MLQGCVTQGAIVGGGQGQIEGAAPPGLQLCQVFQPLPGRITKVVHSTRHEQ